MRYSGLFIAALAAAVWFGVLPAPAQQDDSEMPEEVLMVRPDAPPERSVGEIAQPAGAPGAKTPLELSYLERHGDWLLTFHEGITEYVGHEKYHSRVGLYRRSGSGFCLVAEWFSGVVVFLERPRFFHTEADGRRVHLLWVPARFYGTGSYRGDSAYELDDDAGMRAVAFEPAPLGYARLVKAGVEGAYSLEGEGVWKGEQNTIHKPEPGAWQQLSFTFYIWNKGDGNANPTAGRVDGAYKVFRGEGDRLRIEIDRFKRVDFDKS